MSMTERNWHFTILTAGLALSPWGFYLYWMDCSLLECCRLLLGLALLWGPCGVLLYQLLWEVIEDRICRFTFAWASSYAVTTLCYFALAVLKLTILFYLLQAFLVVLAAAIAFRRRLASPTIGPAQPRRWDLRLVFLIGASLVVNLRYQEPWRVTREQGQYQYSFCLFPDQLYFVGQAYALDEHIPPRQSMIRAGTPERAYHNFPHVTTMLIARYTLLCDMLRAHLLYHYAVIEVLLSLSLFCIARTITGTGWPGYAAIFLMYLLPNPWPPLKDQTGFFYFTLFPHVSSGLLPISVSSPQMYSGLVVLHGALLGLVWMCKTRAESRPNGPLVLVLALITAASLRFRVHLFLVLAPVFEGTLAILWLRTRQRYLVASAAIGLISQPCFYGKCAGRSTCRTPPRSASATTTSPTGPPASSFLIPGPAPRVSGTPSGT
jgi:hypothetical protein